MKKINNNQRPIIHHFSRVHASLCHGIMQCSNQHQNLIWSDWQMKPVPDFLIRARNRVILLESVHLFLTRIIMS